MDESSPSDGDTAADTDSPADDTTTSATPTETADASVRLTYDPYAGVDWDTIEHHKSDFHVHFAKMDYTREWIDDESRYRNALDVIGDTHEEWGGPEPAIVVDVLDELGYTVYAAGDGGGAMRWPWDQLADQAAAAAEREGQDGNWQNRDATEMGVVSFPGAEIERDEHVFSIFSDLIHPDIWDAEVDFDTRLDQIEAITSIEGHHVPKGDGGMAVLAHPARYYDDPDEGWKRYREDFETVSYADGLVGMEVLNKENWTQDGWQLTDLDLWDNLLTEYGPERPIWGYSVDDTTKFKVGRDLDCRWTTVLLDPADFDPSEQESSRSAAASAYREGRTIIHEQARWDDDTEDPTPEPAVRSIDADATAIEIEASDDDVIEWISSGEVVHEGPRLEVTPEHAPYVRAQLWNEADGEKRDGAITVTQPFGVAPK
jgi:hypothetical protein